MSITEMRFTRKCGEDESRFRFIRRQRLCKERRDAWQTSQYLEAAINNVPNLVWFKDKDGIHEKVNDSFCNFKCSARAACKIKRNMAMVHPTVSSLLCKFLIPWFLC